MKRHLPRFAIIAALGFAGAAQAADVGRVLLAAGDTVAVRGNQTVKLTFGTAVQDKDVLRTGPASNLQVRFTDESIVSMKESSELRIDDFQFTGKEDGSERAFFRLIKGGLRTVTGLIGRANNKNYQMSTTTATIGIRGTDYAATLCQGDCRNNDGSPAKDGLYGRTHGQSHGTNRIDVANAVDSKTFGINENFFVADAKSLVERLLVSPDFVSNRLESRKQGGSKGGSGGSGTEQAAAGGAAAESRPSTTPEPLPQLQFVATQDLGPQGTPQVVLPVLPPANGFVVVYPLPSTTTEFPGFIIFDDDLLGGTFNSLNQLTSYGSLGTFPAGSLSGGTITDTGSLTLSNGQIITWGRWTGNTLNTVLDGSTFAGAPVLFGTATGLDTNNTSLLGGVATYTYAGGPRPVDAGGNVGSIMSTSATINFTQQTTQLSLSISFPSIVASGVNTGPADFSVSGPGTRVVSQGQSFIGDFFGTLTGTCNGAGCFDGTAVGFYGAGTAGPNGYEFAVFGGLLFETNAGDVAFLNAYLNSSFTPGPAPFNGQVVGELAFASAAPSFANTAGTGSQPLFSGTNLIAFGNGSAGSALSGSLGSGTVIETGSTSLVDGGTMNWGRWVGATTVFPSPNTGAISPPTGVPYVIGDGNTVVPTSGTFLYTFAGGPNPVNTSGTVGTFNDGAFNVSFGATSGTLSIAIPLSLTVSGVNFSLSSCVSGCSFVNSPLVPGNMSTVVSNMSINGTCSGGICATASSATANATGVFVGPQGAGFAVAGNVFSPAPTVSFAGAFKR